MIRRFFPALLLSGLLAATGQLRAASAFDAVKTAGKQVNETARKSVVQITGKPGAPGILPVEWEVLFYDPYADQHGTMVTVAGETIISIQQGYTQLDKMRLFAYKQEEIIAPQQMQKDSSDVLSILQATNELKGVTIVGLPMHLKKDGKGPLAPAVWFVEIMAEGKDKEPVSIGKAKINATNGIIGELKLDLKKIGK